PNPGGFYEWTTNNGLILDGFGEPEILVGASGTYCVFSFDPQTGCDANACFTVGGGGNPPVIEVVAGMVCENPDSLGAGCQKVCSNTTITYNVPNAGGADVNWTIEGSDDFSVNGEQVTVTWGEAGFGEVTAAIGNPNPPTPPQIDCGQLDYNFNAETGSIYVFVSNLGIYLIHLLR
ncbi:MAG: hypothetical protein AAGA35_03725, partial [Patescibacteria group bacterium]